MTRLASFPLALALGVLACAGSSTNSAAPTAPTPAPAEAPASTEPASPEPARDEPASTNAGEAPSGLGLEQANTIELTRPTKPDAGEVITEPEEIKTLVAALGNGPILEVVPKCMPKVVMTFKNDEVELARVGFCDATLRDSAMRIDGPRLGTGTLKVADPEPFKAYLNQ